MLTLEQKQAAMRERWNAGQPLKQLHQRQGMLKRRTVKPIGKIGRAYCPECGIYMKTIDGLIFPHKSFDASSASARLSTCLGSNTEGLEKNPKFSHLRK